MPQPLRLENGKLSPAHVTQYWRDGFLFGDYILYKAGLDFYIGVKEIDQ